MYGEQILNIKVNGNLAARIIVNTEGQDETALLIWELEDVA